MKKFSFIIAFFGALIALVSCGGSSNGFKTPENLDGQLGEYYTIKSTEIQPEEANPDAARVTYSIIVELEKNDKMFDFTTSGMHCVSSADELDELHLGEWSITGTIFNADGERLDRIRPRKRDVKTLLTDCSQPGQTMKIKMEADIKKEDVDVDKTIVVRGLMKAPTVGNIYGAKEAVEAAKEMQKRL